MAEHVGNDEQPLPVDTHQESINHDPSDDFALVFLARNGFLPLVLADHAGLTEAYATLQRQAATFFELSENSSSKRENQARRGPQASEEGYSRIVNEKCILTVRTTTHCPKELDEAVQKVWQLTGVWLSQILQAIAQTLELDKNAFAPIVDSCISIPRDGVRTPTLLRLFRYDRPSESSGHRVNAEAHRDLGLLSLVVGHSPGLYVQQPHSRQWIPIEEEPYIAPQSKDRSQGLTATLLSGQTLAYLTRHRYIAGAHGVVCAPASEANEYDPFRYSIVFTLRPAEVSVSLKNFESRIVGSFKLGDSDTFDLKELFAGIQKQHYNVNAAPDVRDRQRQEKRKQKG